MKLLQNAPEITKTSKEHPIFIAKKDTKRLYVIRVIPGTLWKDKTKPEWQIIDIKSCWWTRGEVTKLEVFNSLQEAIDYMWEDGYKVYQLDDPSELKSFL